ncbi:sugar ABC transporter substrate-binding protein [Lapillicoccus jejuensis]|uniref:Monosaccharide ABC transporter substrate-binding protein (CUT2 family) n=1 Tax=Lapillicoccus jejuensis TaxID=402171 RepID=A0A542DY33_9MICO|nr:substrate-binding domain-containing protein [Lapillicoccus jejuensis]TQJ07988.1 monosaccharide ABC transporter substrate-binding protein (CUT2 family) [Lapillicoccus jejuensis]
MSSSPVTRTVTRTAPARRPLRPGRRAVALATVAALAVGLAGCSKKADGAGAGASGGAKLTASQVKLALVPGGPHPYFQPWKTAGEKAKTDFGLGQVTFNETAGWDQTKQNDVLTSLAAQGYNAFGIFGVSPDNINSTFTDLEKKGFTVASLASCPAGDKDEAAFCLSTDVESAAYKAAKAAIEAMGGQGDLVHLTGNKVDSNTQRRIAGVQKAVDETGGKVKLVQTITDIDVDLQSAQKAVADLLAARGKDLQGIVTTAYNPAVAAASGVKQAGLPIKVVAIDDDQTILAGISDGSVAATVTQNPVGQGYVGGYALMKLSTGCTMKHPGVVIDSGSFVVTKANVATYDQERQAKTAELKKAFDAEYLSCS